MKINKACIDSTKDHYIQKQLVYQNQRLSVNTYQKKTFKEYRIDFNKT